MQKKSLLIHLDQVENIATASRLKRMLANPVKYFRTIIFRELVYSRKKRSKEVKADAFFGIPMHVLLPSSTDIYLTGGKSHSSEIRLAKFIIKHFNEGDIFLDVGAHYGYFSMLAAQIAGKSGKVFAFEASPVSFQILSKNAVKFENLIAINKVIADTNESLTFHEFPNLYSEYNTLDISQYVHEPWFPKFKPRPITMEAILLSEYLKQNAIAPSMIKIDVEGAEYKVLKGLGEYLKAQNLSIAMEYLSDKRGNDEHKKAEGLLKQYGYRSFRINNNGELENISDIPGYLSAGNLESDNMVFINPG